VSVCFLPQLALSSILHYDYGNPSGYVLITLFFRGWLYRRSGGTKGASTVQDDVDRVSMAGILSDESCNMVAVADDSRPGHDPSFGRGMACPVGLVLASRCAPKPNRAAHRR